MAMEVRPVDVVAVRQLYQDLHTNDVYRVVFTGRGQPLTYLCNILGEKLIVRDYRTEEFRRLIDADNKEHIYVRLDDDPFETSRQVHVETIAHDTKSEANWRVIRGLVEGDDFDPGPGLEALLRKSSRRRCLVDYAKSHRFSVPLLYKLLRRYLQRGMTEEAVASQYPNCGKSRTNVLYVSEVGSDGILKSEPIKKQYRRRPGAPPEDGVENYALPGDVLEKLFWQHLDIYTTWEQGPWHAPPEAKALGKKLRRTSRHDNGIIRISKRAAVKALMPDRHHKRAKGPRGRPSQADLVDSINYELRRSVEVWENGRIAKLEFANKNIVTDRQLGYFWLKTRPSFVRRRMRHPAEAEVRRRMPAHGRARQHIKGPGQVFLIDATVLDCYVVSPLDRKLVLGRPTLYFVVDLYSGMIVGLYLGLEHPSREACALALVNTVRNKRELCAEYGFTITDEDWPTHFLPDEFAADRGVEFRYANPWRALANELGAGISNAPPGQPVWRGVGERRFGSVPRLYQRAAFGVVERDFGERFARRYPWDARYTCSEVMLMLLRAVHIYHRTPTSGRQPPPVEMIQAGKADTPLNRWKWGLENETGCLRVATPEELRRVVWPWSKARMFAKGVLWKRAWYRCEPLNEEFLRTSPEKGKKTSRSVNIQYDPADMGEIRLVAFGYEVVCKLDPNLNEADLDGVSLAEWQDVCKADAANRRRARRALQAERFKEMYNTQLDDEDARIAQESQLREADMKHPDARDTRKNRRHHRVLEKQVRGKQARASRSAKPDSTCKAKGGTEPEISSAGQAAEENMRRAMYR